MPNSVDPDEMDLYESSDLDQYYLQTCLIGSAGLKGLRKQMPTLKSGPSCSKLTTSLVNDSLKFTSSDSKYAEIFC